MLLRLLHSLWKKRLSSGEFREELYYRLNVVPLNIPRLQDRKEDIPALVDFFMQECVSDTGAKPRSLSEGALAALQGYVWPGNVRQLKNLVEWLLVTARFPQEQGDDDAMGGAIQASELPQEITQFVHASLKNDWQVDMISLPLRDAREVFEREYLLAQITRFNGNISRTAQFVGMERSALHRKLKSLHITTSEREEMNDEDGRSLKTASA